MIHISKIVSTAKKINSKNGSQARVFHLERESFHFEERFPRFDEYFLFFLSLHVGDPIYYTHRLASDYYPTRREKLDKSENSGIFFSVALFSFFLFPPATSIITYDCTLLFSRKTYASQTEFESS